MFFLYSITFIDKINDFNLIDSLNVGFAEDN